MKTQKGYIIPVIAVTLLLVLAGFSLFSGKKVESPIVENIATSTSDTVITPVTPFTTIVSNESKKEENATGTASTTIKTPDNNIKIESTSTLEVSSGSCSENSDCKDGKICYFKPGGEIGACTTL